MTFKFEKILAWILFMAITVHAKKKKKKFQEHIYESSFNFLNPLNMHLYTFLQTPFFFFFFSNWSSQFCVNNPSNLGEVSREEIKRAQWLFIWLSAFVSLPNNRFTFPSFCLNALQRQCGAVFFMFSRSDLAAAHYTEFLQLSSPFGMLY